MKLVLSCDQLCTFLALSNIPQETVKDNLPCTTGSNFNAMDLRDPPRAPPAENARREPSPSRTRQEHVTQISANADHCKTVNIGQFFITRPSVISLIEHVLLQKKAHNQHKKHLDNKHQRIVREQNDPGPLCIFTYPNYGYQVTK